MIRGSFARAIAESTGTKDNSEAEREVPDALVRDLLERFASRRGYMLYDDVEPFFRGVRAARGGQGGRKGRKVVVGVVSNSDDRISPVLESLGVSVRDARAGEEKRRGGRDLPGFEEEREKEGRSGDSLQGQEEKDVDFILTSYQVGAEKPDKLIWDVASRTAAQGSADDGSWERVHVGDDYGKDYRGAQDAGWKAYYLARDAEAAVQAPEGTMMISSLLDLLPKLEADRIQ